MATNAVREREVVGEESVIALLDYAPASTAEVDTPRCAHYWVIEPANGPVSLGECQVCHEVKEFKNFIDEHDYSN